MATNNAESEGDKEDKDKDRLSSAGRSPYSRDVTDSDMAEWLKRKEEKQTKTSSFGTAKRSGLSRTRINPVSKKQKKRNNDYKEATREHYEAEENRKCFLCGCTNNLSIHHRNKRGKETADPFYFITLCLIGGFMDEKYPESNHSHSGGCHGWTEGNKDKARELELIK